MSDILNIAGHAIGPGEHKRVRLEIARLPTGTLIDIPIHVFRGPHRGPTVLLQGGLHGDEVGGVEILRRMIRDECFSLHAGTAIVIPVLNVFGFIHFSREVPDGKDINRSFPGIRTGSLAGRVAWHLMNDVFPHIDAGIDFHTGGGRRNNFPQVRYSPGFAASQTLASAFGAPFVFPSKLIPKSFRKAAADRDVPIIVYEAGESLRFDEHAIEVGVAGTLRTLAHLGLVPPVAHHRNRTIALTNTKWLRARRAGLFRAVVRNGAPVAREEILGTVSDTDGRRERPLSARRDGFVICVNNLPVVNRGDALIRLGYE